MMVFFVLVTLCNDGIVRISVWNHRILCNRPNILVCFPSKEIGRTAINYNTYLLHLFSDRDLSGIKS